MTDFFYFNEKNVLYFSFVLLNDIDAVVMSNNDIDAVECFGAQT